MKRHSSGQHHLMSPTRGLCNYSHSPVSSLALLCLGPRLIWWDYEWDHFYNSGSWPWYRCSVTSTYGSCRGCTESLWDRCQCSRTTSGCWNWCFISWANIDCVSPNYLPLYRTIEKIFEGSTVSLLYWLGAPSVLHILPQMHLPLSNC